ncbi:hypothetical protein N7513_003553 [Penicillium frequentans]|nr:hypothetical protein N7513_004713 [Penicillium glabrum]KAJ5555911.1 hypothetical protein N7513_003553 [Penicillium glabrum]
MWPRVLHQSVCWYLAWLSAALGTRRTRWTNCSMLSMGGAGSGRVVNWWMWMKWEPAQFSKIRCHEIRVSISAWMPAISDGLGRPWWLPGSD